MKNNAFARKLAIILGFFGISANFLGTLISLFTGLAHVSRAENFIIDTIVCFACTLILAFFFYYYCFKTKNYNRFIFVCITFCGFVTFTAMYIVTGNIVCGFPFYMMIIPVCYGFSLPVKKNQIFISYFKFDFLHCTLCSDFYSPIFSGPYNSFKHEHDSALYKFFCNIPFFIFCLLSCFKTIYETESKA